MAPMTRCRAINNIPNELMATYYAQRVEAGLIVTEGIAPSANGLGYARIPGLFSDEQIKGWQLVTEAVHEKGGLIFAQLMHTGRVSHPDNMVDGAEIVAPSAIGHTGEIWTDTNGNQKHPAPKEMSIEDIQQAKNEFVEAAKNAIKAGFDGVEIHGANGYLVDQFINTASNKREDEYGGSIENRSRFVLEVAQGIVEEIGAEKTGIRLSPYGVFNDMEIFETIPETYIYLAKELSKLNLAYIHVVDHSAMGAPDVPFDIKQKIRKNFEGTIIASGGKNVESATTALENESDLVAFGRPFIANPDLVFRLKNQKELAEVDMDTFFSADEKGYTDYSTWN